MNGGFPIRPVLAGFPLALSVLALLAACSGDPGPVAGTVTTTGNTLVARVLPDGGAPFPIPVTLYSREYQPGFEGPAAQPLPAQVRFDTQTDSSGALKVTVTPGISYVLVAASGGETPRVQWLEDIRPGAAGDTTLLDTVIIRPAASLKGRILSYPGDPDSSRILWAGYLGTGSFARVDRQGDFALAELPAGSRTLAVLRDRRKPQGWVRETFFAAGINLQEGKSHVMDSLVLPEAPPGPQPLPAVACLENPAVLVPWTAAAGIGKAELRFRTIGSTAPAQLLELDICTGSWRTVMDLPQHPFALFSDTAEDIALFPAESEIIWIDPRAGTYRSFPYDFGEANMDYISGRFYTLARTDSLLRIFPDEAAFLSNTPSRSLRWPYPIPNSTKDIAAVEKGIHYLLQTDRLELYFLDLQDPLAPKTSAPLVLQGFTGTLKGFVDGKDGTVWVLNSGNELFEYRVDSPLPIRRIMIEGSVPLHGLTRFH